MEEISHHINQLKSLVSLRYIDPLVRNRFIETVQLDHSTNSAHLADQANSHNYLIKIEELH